MESQAVNKPPIECKIPTFVKTAGVKGAVGFLAATLFSVINPLSGAVFAAVHSIFQPLLTPGVEELLSTQNYKATQIYVYAVGFLISSAASIAVTVSIGLSITFHATIFLSLAMIPTSFLVDYLFNSINFS